MVSLVMKRGWVFLLLCVLTIGCSAGESSTLNVAASETRGETANLDQTTANAINRLEIGKPDADHPSRYPTVKEITEPKQVERFKSWVADIAWERAEVSMSRPPDLKIVGTSTDPGVSGVRETFAVWLSPNGRNYEFVVEGRSLYGQMSEKDSGRLRQWIESS